MTYSSPEEFIDGFLLGECHYLFAKEVPGGRYAAVAQFAYTYAIVTGVIGDLYGYDNRWCYRRATDAWAALLAWDGQAPEPQGWHRHPGSGRRIAEDDFTHDEDGNLVPIGAIYVRR